MDLTSQRAGRVRPEEARDVDPLALPGSPPPPALGRRGRALVVGLLVLAALLRFATWSHLWLDEALSVNIARLPLGDLPDALQHDGAPPVYYVLLHGWMRVFGTGDFAVRALSGLFAVGVIPLTWLAAKRVGGTRMAWAAAILVATSPFAIRYGTEARMYSLVMVLVLTGFLAVRSLLDGGGTGHAALLAVVTGLALLTHYWSFYLLATAVVALAVAAKRGVDPARSGARRGLLGLGAGCLLFLPWAPTFLDQLRHTGTPWGRPGDLRSLFDTVTHFAGGYWNPGIILGLLYFGLIVLAVFGSPVDDRRVLLDLRPRSPGRELAALAFGTLVVALVAGRISGSAFAVRYAAVLFPLMIILVALGTEVFTDRRTRGGILALAAVLGLWASVPNLVGERTNAPRVASALEAHARAGDVVVYCPDQLGPAVTRELQAEGLVQLTFPRATPPDIVDWVDYQKVIKATSTSGFARMVLDRAGAEHDVWVVWAPAYRTLGTRCQNLIERLGDARPDNQRVVKVPTKYFERPGLVRFRP